MARGYPPSHRDHTQPQPEVCDVCGLYVEGRRLRTLDTDGLRGRRVCDIHPWRDIRPKTDIYREHPHPEMYVGQGRVYDPGDEIWWEYDPLEAIKLVLSPGDMLLVADDLATGFTSWTDRKSGVSLSVNGSTTLAVAADSIIGDKKSITFTGASTEPLESAGISWDSADGFTVFAVVKFDSATPAAQQNLFGQVSAPNLLFVNVVNPVYESRAGNVTTTTHSAAITWRYQIVSVRASNAGIDIRLDGVQIGSYPALTMPTETGQIILAGNNSKAKSFDGQLAGAVIALSDLGEQDTAKIIGSLKTYYGIYD